MLESYVPSMLETLWPQIQFLPWGDGFLVYAWMVTAGGGPRLPADSPGPGNLLSVHGGGRRADIVSALDLSRTEILDMELDSEGQLLVWTCEEDTLFLTVADPDTGAVRQRLELLETEDPDLWLTHQGENCLLVVGRRRGALLPPGAAGRHLYAGAPGSAPVGVRGGSLLPCGVPAFSVRDQCPLGWRADDLDPGRGSAEYGCPSPSPWRCTTERGGSASLCWTAAWAGSGRSGPTTIGSGTRTRWPWTGRMPKGLV